MAVRTSWTAGEVLTAADLSDTFGAKLSSSAYLPGMTCVATASPSAIATVNIDNCFTSTYQNYIIAANLVSGSLLQVSFRMRASGADDTSSNYSYQQLIADSTTLSLSRTTAQNNGFFMTTDTTGTYGIIEVFRPAEAVATRIKSHYCDQGVNVRNLWFHNYHNVATAYDGITLYVASSNLTGTIRVYGLRNSTT